MKNMIKIVELNNECECDENIEMYDFFNNMEDDNIWKVYDGMC